MSIHDNQKHAAKEGPGEINMDSPAKGDDGHSHGCTGAVLGSACISWHPEQVLAVSSISLSIPGHQM